MSKPTIFLNDIIKVAKRLNLDDDFVKHQLIQALPASLRPQIVSESERAASLQEFGRIADAILIYHKPHDTISVVQETVTQPKPVSPNRPSHSRGTNQTNNFSDHNNNNFNQPSYFSNNIPFGIRAYINKQRAKMCRAHIYFGVQARTCKPWCTMKGNPNVTTMQPSSRSSSPSNYSRPASPSPN